jgi:hypothetical protein
MVFPSEGIHLVDGINDRFGRCPKQIQDIMIMGGNPLASVKQGYYGIGVFNGVADLVVCFLNKLVFFGMVKTTGVNNREFNIVKGGRPVVAVPCNAGHAVYQCVSGLGQAVEKGRLSGIWPADNGNNWFHGFLSDLIDDSVIGDNNINEFVVGFHGNLGDNLLCKGDGNFPGRIWQLWGACGHNCHGRFQSASFFIKGDAWNDGDIYFIEVELFAPVHDPA